MMALRAFPRARDDDGIFIVNFAIMILALIAVLGFSLDSGNLYLTRARMQRAVDVAAYGGMTYIVEALTAGREVNADALRQHVRQIALVNLEANGIAPARVQALDVKLCRDSSCSTYYTSESAEQGVSGESLPTGISVQGRVVVDLYLIDAVYDFDPTVGAGVSGKSTVIRKPLAVVLAIDHSVSMHEALPDGTERLTATRDSIGKLLAVLNPRTDFAGLISFSDAVRVHIPLKEDPGFDYAHFAETVEKLVSKEKSTNFSLVLKLVRDEFQRIASADVTRSAILFTDGKANAVSAAFANAKPGLKNYANPESPYRDAGPKFRNYYYVEGEKEQFDMYEFSYVPFYNPEGLPQYATLKPLWQRRITVPGVEDPTMDAYWTYGDSRNLWLRSDLCRKQDIAKKAENLIPVPPSAWASSPCQYQHILGYENVGVHCEHIEKLPDHVELRRMASGKLHDEMFISSRNAYGRHIGTDTHCIGRNICIIHPWTKGRVCPPGGQNGATASLTTLRKDKDYFLSPRHLRWIKYNFYNAPFVEADTARLEGITLHALVMGQQPLYRKNPRDPASADFYRFQKSPVPGVTAYQELVGLGSDNLFMRRLVHDPQGSGPAFNKFPYKSTEAHSGRFVFTSASADEVQENYGRIVRKMLLDSLRIVE